jgi:hypothetical protein
LFWCFFDKILMTLSLFLRSFLYLGHFIASLIPCISLLLLHHHPILCSIDDILRNTRSHTQTHAQIQVQTKTLTQSQTGTSVLSLTLSARLTFAPLSNRSVVVAVCPVRADHISAVVPLWFHESSRIFITFTLSYIACRKLIRVQFCHIYHMRYIFILQALQSYIYPVNNIDVCSSIQEQLCGDRMVKT